MGFSGQVYELHLGRNKNNSFMEKEGILPGYRYLYISKFGNANIASDGL